MNESIQPQHIDISAAGGLLWRETPQGRQIALIFRNRYQDWTLPKGKVKAKETWLEAAMREVREETGYEVIVTGFAGVIAYPVEGRIKVVRFWHMVPAAPAREQLDLGEVTRFEWLPVEEAVNRLQYPLERALLEAYLPA